MRKSIFTLIFYLIFGIIMAGMSIAVDLGPIQGAWLFDEDDGDEVLDISGKNNNTFDVK